MKPNFWQIVGALLLLVGVAMLLWREFGGNHTPKPAPPTVTQPADQPPQLPPGVAPSTN